MKLKKTIVLLPGDGIGPEVTRAAASVLQECAREFHHQFTMVEMPVGGSALDKTGTPLPNETLDACRKADAIFLGAVGGPKWDSLAVGKRPETGLLGLRKALGLYVNLRPVKLIEPLRGISPLRPERLGELDIEIVRELLERTVQAGEILKLDPAFCKQVASAMDKLPPFKIGKAGNLQEWQQDYADAEPGHRHISHLWALFPGTQISIQHTPELAKAARVTLERRLAAGGGQTGWSRAWVVNYWDHLGEGEQAYDSMAVLFRQSTFPNLMDTHPPGLFQIDGNLGGANGMLEALIQSRWYPDHAEVDLLPALPSVWSRGSVSGIRVRGGAEFDLQWEKGKLHSSRWRASQDEAFDFRLPAGQHLSHWTANGKAQRVPAEKDGVIRIAARRGAMYEFAFE